MSTLRLDRISSAVLDRIFETQIRPALLDPTPSSATPSAVFVAGAPGSGRDYAAERVRSHLAHEGRTPLVVSAAQLRPFHPPVPAQPAASGRPSNDDVEQHIGRWFASVVDDAIDRRLDLVLSSSFRQPQVALALASRLRSAGYDLAAVIVACDLDRCRQVAMAQFDIARRVGLTPHLVSAPVLHEAYARLPDLVSSLERGRGIDRLQIVSEEGRLVYANHVTPQGQWQQEPAAAERLQEYRERNRTPRDLAQSALRWHTLAHRLTTQETVPRDIAAQSVAWRNEAVQLAEQDPEAAAMLRRGREAEAFRVMAHEQLLSEFPHLAKAVAKMEEAQQYASKSLVDPGERERFVVQARERIAERIAEGRIAARAADDTNHSPRTR